MSPACCTFQILLREGFSKDFVFLVDDPGMVGDHRVQAVHDVVSVDAHGVHNKLTVSLVYSYMLQATQTTI